MLSFMLIYMSHFLCVQYLATAVEGLSLLPRQEESKSKSSSSAIRFTQLSDLFYDVPENDSAWFACTFFFFWRLYVLFDNFFVLYSYWKCSFSLRCVLHQTGQPTHCDLKHPVIHSDPSCPGVLYIYVVPIFLMLPFHSLFLHPSL